jgi:hypothetical protein
VNVFLGVLQIILAVAFLAAGSTKVIRPKSALRERMGWVDDYSDTGVKLIGAVEILGALGLILPAFTGIATILTPLAAAGLAIVMIGAVITHLRRGEVPGAVPAAVLFILSAIVVWGRFGPYHF